MLPDWRDYKPFSLYAAGRLYARLTHPRQFLSPDSGKQLKKINSILNFLRKTIRPMIIDYQRQNFGQVINPEMHSSTAEDIRYNFIERARIQESGLLEADFKYYFTKICNTVKMFIGNSPYANDKVMCHRIYLSCMMSLLNQVTLSNNNKERYKSRIKSRFKTEEFLVRVYEEERRYSIVLVHLNRSMYNYISTLVNRISKEICNDLRGLIGDHEPTDAVIQSLLADQLEEVLNAEE